MIILNLSFIYIQFQIFYLVRFLFRCLHQFVLVNLDNFEFIECTIVYVV